MRTACFRTRNLGFVALCLAFMAAGACSNSGEADSAIVGVVKSTDSMAGELTVVTPEGTEFPFQVGSGTQVRDFTDEKPFSELTDEEPPSDRIEEGEIAEGPRAQGDRQSRAESEDWTQEAHAEGDGIEALEGKEGRDVVVLFNVAGTEMRAVAVEDLGYNALRRTQGKLLRVDNGEAVLQTAAGGEETFDLVNGPAVVTEEGLADIDEVLENGDEQVTVYYSTQGGRRVAHLIKADATVTQAGRL